MSRVTPESVTLITTGLEKVVFGEEKMEQFEKGAHSKLRAVVGGYW